MMKDIIQWANDNAGFVGLIAIALMVFGLGKKYIPSKEKKRRKIKDEKAHSANLKNEIEKNTEWDEFHGGYDEFLIRDSNRKLPDSDERRSRFETPYTTMQLIKIENEFLEFTDGSFGIKNIKKVADSWYFADHTDDDSIKVYTVVHLHYRDIDFIRWETDWYWEWPQIFCRFTSANKFPFIRVFHAEKVPKGDRFFFKWICDVKDVSPVPKELTQFLGPEHE